MRARLQTLERVTPNAQRHCATWPRAFICTGRNTSDARSVLLEASSRHSDRQLRRLQCRACRESSLTAGHRSVGLMELLPSELKTPPLGAVALVGLPSVHASISAHLRSELRPPLHRRVRWRS